MSRVLGTIVIGAFVFVAGAAHTASADDRLGGHIGIVVPIISHGNGETTTVADTLTTGFPMGITVRKSDRLAFDLEVVPAVQNGPLNVGLTIHPGIITAVGGGWGTGARLAFDVSQPSWGVTPILNHGLLKLGDEGTLFGEFVFPVRFQENTAGRFTSVGFGIHVGVGF